VWRCGEAYFEQPANWHGPLLQKSKNWKKWYASSIHWNYDVMITLAVTEANGSIAHSLVTILQITAPSGLANFKSFHPCTLPGRLYATNSTDVFNVVRASYGLLSK
jgi:hypothetical protein